MTHVARLARSSRQPGAWIRIGTKARANEIEGSDLAIYMGEEQVLLDDRPGIAAPLHAKPVEDVQSITDLVAAGSDELKRV